MRDNRVTMLATANAIAHTKRRTPLFVFKSGDAKAIYLFGRLVHKSQLWQADHKEPFRSAYKRYHQRVDHILREPTDAELANLLPALHPLERKGGKPLTVGELQDFQARLWKAYQRTMIIKLIQQEGVQYIKEDAHP